MKSDQVRTNWREVQEAARLGDSTIVEHYNRAVSIVRPYSDTVDLWEWDSGLWLERGDEMWYLGVPDNVYLNGTFAADCEAWVVTGDWEPNEDDGQTRSHLTDAERFGPNSAKHVASWNPSEGVQVLDEPGGHATDYLGREHATTTTVYGTWANYAPGDAATLRDSIEAALTEYDTEHDVDAIEADYRAAIDAALPIHVTLNGDTFHGPPAKTERDDQQIRSAIEEVDNDEFWTIVERHAK